MVGRVFFSAVLVGMLALLLSTAFPGRRPPAAAPTIAAVEWHGQTRAKSFSFRERIDPVTCREMQRQVAQQPEITLACLEPWALNHPL